METRLVTLVRFPPLEILEPEEETFRTFFTWGDGSQTQAVQTTKPQGAKEGVTRWWGRSATAGRVAGPWLVVGPGRLWEQISGLEMISLYASVKQK